MNAIPRQKCFPSDPNVTFVPMIFGGERGMDNCGEKICGGDIPEEYKVRECVCVQISISDNLSTKIILGFNEPNMADQANMSPQEAALEWIEVMGR